jgi:dTDP-4-amino-4,6-dideoxygalactose transaminase
MSDPNPVSAAMLTRIPEDLGDRPIPVFRPYLGREVQEATQQALLDGWLGLGKRTREFEDAIEDYLGVRGTGHAVSTNSCTEALHLAAELIGLGPGDEVICPSFTYVAGHQAMSMTGADVVFCDVEPDTLGVDLESVRSLITPATKAIMAVHYAGLVPRDLDAIHELAQERGLRVIEDAAHAFGSRSAGRPVGSFGDLTCFSFGPVKIVTTLEGGAVMTNRAEDLQTLHELRLIGVDSDTDARYKNSRTWEYDVVRQGYRCHLGAIPSAIGLSQIALIDEFIDNRQSYCRYYDEGFADLPGVTLFDTDWKDVSPFIYVLRVADRDTRDGLVAHLKQQGVSSGIHFLGAHTFSFYAHCRRGDLSATELAGDQVITLPLHSYMTDGTLDRVIAAVRSFLTA